MMEPPPLAAKGALSEKGRCPRAPSVRPVPRTSGGSAAERPEDYGERPTLPAVGLRRQSEAADRSASERMLPSGAGR